MDERDIWCDVAIEHVKPAPHPALPSEGEKIRTIGATQTLSWDRLGSRGGVLLKFTPKLQSPFLNSIYISHLTNQTKACKQQNINIMPLLEYTSKTKTEANHMYQITTKVMYQSVLAINWTFQIQCKSWKTPNNLIRNAQGWKVLCHCSY